MTKACIELHQFFEIIDKFEFTSIEAEFKTIFFNENLTHMLLKFKDFQS